MKDMTMYDQRTVFEKMTQMDPAKKDLRMIASIAGYTLRPAAVLGFLLVVWPSGRPNYEDAKGSEMRSRRLLP